MVRWVLGVSTTSLRASPSPTGLLHMLVCRRVVRTCMCHALGSDGGKQPRRQAAADTLCPVLDKCLLVCTRLHAPLPN